jgi:hypothetical protein
VLFDPTRNMKQQLTKQVTPSLTFMPRAMEWALYDEDRKWQMPDPAETFLDPPSPVMSKKDIKRRKKEKKKQQVKEKRERLKERLRAMASSGQNDKSDSKSHLDYSSESSYTSDTEYDEEYEKKLRADYQNPRPWVRHRDFARKYAWSTFALVHHQLTQTSTTEMLASEDGPLVPELLTSVLLDDSWELLAEMRLRLDQLDNDLSTSFNANILESVGTKTRQNVIWMQSTLRELREWAAHLLSDPYLSKQRGLHLRTELSALVEEIQELKARTEQAIHHLVACTSLAQASMVIDQTSGVNKLTELAFLFVPLSFVTSIFSMQVLEFNTDPPPLWTWGLTLSIIFLVSYLVRMTLRSPSVRVFAMTCRVVILNRFTPSQARSPSRRLNSVGNLAIAKFIVFMTALVSFVLCVMCLCFAFLFLIFAGIWLGAAAVALYFIITRWPDPAVLVPCFIALPVAAAGLWVSWYWNDEITDMASAWMLQSILLLKRILPSGWTLDRVDDEDLAKEGVNTYARQAIVLATT